MPTRSPYTVVLDGQTLPAGMTIDSGSDGRITVVEGDVHQAMEFDLTDKKAVNFFFTAG